MDPKKIWLNILYLKEYHGSFLTPMRYSNKNKHKNCVLIFNNGMSLKYKLYIIPRRRMRNFKKYIGILLLLTQMVHAENISGKSILTGQSIGAIARDITFTTLMDQQLETGSVINRPEIQVSVFGGQSTNIDDLRRFFLFKNKSSLQMNEAPTSDTSAMQDIIGYNFNIYTVNGTQSSIITMNPKQTFAGGCISARHAFKEKWWGAIEIPFLSITNDLGLTEAVEVYGGGLNTELGFDGQPVTATTMLQAFHQPGMLYGKIDGPQTKRGLGDIQLLVGYDFIDKSSNYLALNTGLIVPTSNKPNGEYFWGPVLGNNKHTGIVLGAYGHAHVYHKNDCYLWFTWSTKNIYLVPNTQKRSFDLTRGPWTRYLAMYRNEQDRISTIHTLGTQGIKTFGINLMTQDVHVSPGFSNFSLTSFSLIKGGFNATLGLTTFIRESENVRFVNQWVLGPEVASFTTDNDTNVLRDIGSLSSSGDLAGPNQIQYEDIDLTSGTATNLFVNSVYGTLGYYHNANHAQLYELGGSYEMSKENNALHRYTIWGKFQLTF